MFKTAKKLPYSMCGTAAVVVGLLGAAAGSASADVLTPLDAAKLTSPFSYSGYSVAPNDTNVIISGSPGQNGTFGSGQIDLNISTGQFAGDALATWCIDIFDDLATSGTYNIINLPPATDDGGNGGNGNPVLNTTTLNEIGVLVHLGDTLLATAGHSDYISSAIQLAIWTVEYPTSAFPNIAFMSTNSNVESLVAGYVNTAETSVFSGYLAEVVNSNTQGLVFETASPVNLATPLPATWTMMLIGLAGFGFFSFPRTRKRSAGIAAA
jgi:hypothetical protein